jgi:hypothetical protein
MLQWAKGEETANSSAPIFVTSLVDGSVISQYQGLINSTLTSQCRDHGLPLYCRYLYSPCTEESEEFALTRQECVSLKGDVCKAEFSLMLQLSKLNPKYSPLVPRCSALEDAMSENHDAMNQSLAFDNSTNVHNSTNVTCHPDYVKTCELCLFSCRRAIDMPIPPGLSLPVDDICQCVFFILVVIFTVMFMVFSIANRKEIFKFPTIYLFYSNAFELFVATVVLIGFAGGPDLFCSYPDILLTLLSPPTAYCTISGVLFHFGAMGIFTTWIVHLGYIIVLLMFPFYGEQVLKKKTKIIHAISLPLILLVTSIPPIVAVSTDGYSVIRFPPSLCLPGSSDLTYSTLSLPLSLGMFILIVQCLLLIILIRKAMKSKASELKNQISGRKAFFSVPEVKLVANALILAIFGVFVLGRLSHTLVSLGEYSELLIRDGLCHLHGERSGISCLEREPFIAQAITGIVTYVMAAIVPITNVIFVLSLSRGKMKRGGRHVQKRKDLPKKPKDVQPTDLQLRNQC